MAIVLIFGVIALIIILFFHTNPREVEDINCKRVFECKNIMELVSSIGYGRVYPYYTSMPLDEVRKIIVRENKGISEFENSVELSRITGGFMSITLPAPESKDIKTVSARLSRNEVISAITIELGNDSARLVSYMYLTQKFGNPLTNSNEFAIWRSNYMVINLDYYNNSINVIDERLLGF